MGIVISVIGGRTGFTCFGGFVACPPGAVGCGAGDGRSAPEEGTDVAEREPPSPDACGAGSNPPPGADGGTCARSAISVIANRTSANRKIPKSVFIDNRAD